MIAAIPATFETQANELKTLFRQLLSQSETVTEQELDERLTAFWKALKDPQAFTFRVAIIARGVVARVKAGERNTLWKHSMDVDGFAMKGLILDIVLLISAAWCSEPEILKLPVMHGNIATRAFQAGGHSSESDSPRARREAPRIIFTVPRGEASRL